MTEQFDIYERLYRAVYPPEIMSMFWKEKGAYIIQKYTVEKIEFYYHNPNVSF